MVVEESRLLGSVRVGFASVVKVCVSKAGTDAVGNDSTAWT